jgi:hypothetical protein
MAVKVERDQKAVTHSRLRCRQLTAGQCLFGRVTEYLHPLAPPRIFEFGAFLDF